MIIVAYNMNVDTMEAFSICEWYDTRMTKHILDTIVSELFYDVCFNGVYSKNLKSFVFFVENEQRLIDLRKSIKNNKMWFYNNSDFIVRCKTKDTYYDCRIDSYIDIMYKKHSNHFECYRVMNVAC